MFTLPVLVHGMSIIRKVLDNGRKKVNQLRSGKLAAIPRNRYPRSFLIRNGPRGGQRKCWSKVVNDLFSTLGLDKAGWLQDIQTGECSLKVFWLSIVGTVSRRGRLGSLEGLSSKVKLSLYDS